MHIFWGKEEIADIENYSSISNNFNTGNYWVQTSKNETNNIFVVKYSFTTLNCCPKLG